MRKSYILTAVGRDRPGIVADLAEMVFESGCNLEDSSMMSLGNEFATMFLMSGEGEELERRLQLAAKHLEYEKCMTIFIKPVEVLSEPPRRFVGNRFRLHTMGEDKAGIVARTARAVAEEEGNIEELSSHLRPAAASGTPLYEMTMYFELPATADVEHLRRRLVEIETSLNIEINLTRI